MLSSVFLYDLICSVSRAVAYDDPLQRQHGLRYDRLKCQLNKCAFITRGRDQNEGRKLRHAQFVVEIAILLSGLGSLKERASRSVAIAKAIHASDHLMYGVRIVQLRKMR